MQTYQGQCHCGSVRFAITSAPITRGLRCTCSICRRKGALMSADMYDNQHFRILSGLEQLGVYRFGSGVAKHYFCTRCGIYPFHETRRQPGSFRVNLGCIDTLDLEQLSVDTFDGKTLLD